ncbi:hypothetical protein OPQ81_011674 [Rhizoctonia solani]|nr:hypothetical protein OPQ81_011674 [Rhizoctonia solani]
MNDISSPDIVGTKYGLEDLDMPLSRSPNSTPKPRKTNGIMVSQAVPLEEPGNTTKYDEPEAVSHSLPKSVWNPEETNNLGSPQGAEAFVCTPQTTRDPVRILIVGPSGSGKTCTITNSYYGSTELPDSISYEATKRTEVIDLHFEEQTFELIDTPGFDNVSMSNVEVFLDIANYLLNLAQISAPKLPMTQSTTHGVDYDGLLDQMAARGSAFSTAFFSGAQAATLPNWVGFVQLLHFYTSQAPIKLSIQVDGPCISHVTLVNRIERELGYHEFKSAQSLLDDQVQQLREQYQQRLAGHNELEAQLRQQLHQSQLEYSSLRSQLQLHENTEQSQVVLVLKDINRMVEDIGRSVSAYLADNYVQPTFGRDSAHVDALHSCDLPTLTRLFCHHDGKSSLIASSTGQGMQIEEFLDYSIRNFLCRFLFLKIFRPFHPEISPSLSKTLIASYENIQKREPQAISGKWRSETFKSLREGSSHEATEAEIERHLHRLSNSVLEPLIKGVFGKDIPLEDAYYTSLRSLIKMAWGWNSHLKCDVIMLGDFVQTYFPRSRFDEMWMEEFEAISPDQTPPFILGTLALGLVCRKAVGRGNPMEETVVCKAVVATKNIFN